MLESVLDGGANDAHQGMRTSLENAAEGRGGLRTKPDVYLKVEQHLRASSDCLACPIARTSAALASSPASGSKPEGKERKQAKLKKPKCSHQVWLC